MTAKAPPPNGTANPQAAHDTSRTNPSGPEATNVTAPTTRHRLTSADMISAFSGLALIAVIVLAGWLTRRYAGLPDNAEAVLGRLVYSVLAPCLLYTGAAHAHLTALFSEPLLVSTAAAAACFGLFPL